MQWMVQVGVCSAQLTYPSRPHMTLPLCFQLGFDLGPSGSALFCDVCSQDSPHTVTRERGQCWKWDPYTASETPEPGV